MPRCRSGDQDQQNLVRGFEAGMKRIGQSAQEHRPDQAEADEQRRVHRLRHHEQIDDGVTRVEQQAERKRQPHDGQITDEMFVAKAGLEFGTLECQAEWPNGCTGQKRIERLTQPAPDQRNGFCAIRCRGRLFGLNYGHSTTLTQLRNMVPRKQPFSLPVCVVAHVFASW